MPAPEAFAALVSGSRKPCGTFQNSPTLARDIDRGVQVAVVDRAAPGTCPTAFSKRELAVDVSTFTACLAQKGYLEEHGLDYVVFHLLP